MQFRSLKEWLVQLGYPETGAGSQLVSQCLQQAHVRPQHEAAPPEDDSLATSEKGSAAPVSDSIDTINTANKAVGTSLADLNLGLKGASLVQTISRPAMGCEFEVLLNQHQHANGVEAAVRSLKHIEYIEGLLSVYRPSSQISKVNQFGTIRSVAVDAATFELVQLGVDVYHWTGGAFDITAGTLSEAWGFSRRRGTMPSDQQIQRALQQVGTQHLLLDSESQTIALNRAGVQINTGGIGKGYALDGAAKLLERSGIDHFMIHGGLSSIAARGHRSNWCADGWNVALKHPWREDETIQKITLRNSALGTSGSGKQFFHFGGKRYSHLIDPRSGWPADQMMSATVICSSGGVADALATGLFILGPQAAIEFCEAHPEISAILVFTDSKSGGQRTCRCNWSDQQK